ncbi:unnamed protein product [Brassica oleracea var. botrytis]
MLCDSQSIVSISASACSIAKHTDGFVIPSLEIEQENANDDSQADTSSPKIKAEDNIHLGPHGGAPPSQLQDGNASSRKQSSGELQVSTSDAFRFNELTPRATVVEKNSPRYLQLFHM